jgi:hypothetical protein
MARVAKYKPLYPWMGGLNTSVDPTILDPQKLTIADNIIFTNSGSRKKRGGQARYNSSQIGGATAAENVVYAIDYWATKSSAKSEYFVAVTDSGKVYRSPFNGTWSSMSTLSLTVTHGGVTHTIMEEDLILGIRGSGVPKVWSNQNTSANLTTLTASSGSLPFSSAWLVTSFLERLFVAGDPANPDRVYVSRAGDYTRWTASSTAGTAITLDVGIGDGDPSGITAIFPGTGADRVLYVAKRRHLYRIDCSDPDQTSWSISLVSREIGVLHQNTVATIDAADVMFASDRGVHTLNQVISSTAVLEGQFLSFPIQEDYKDVMSSADRGKMSAVYLPSLNSYLLSCKRSGQTTFETIYGYNVELKEWFRWTATPCNHLVRRLKVSTGVEELYAAASSGYVNQLLQDDLNDFGSPIVTRIRSTFIAPEGIPFLENQFTGLACLFRSRDNSTFRVYYSVDGITTQNVTFRQRIAGGNVLGTTLLGSPTFLLGQIQSIKPVWNHLAIEEGNAIQLTFEQDGLDQDFELFGIVLEYQTDEEAQDAYRSSLYS